MPTNMRRCIVLVQCVVASQALGENVPKHDTEVVVDPSGEPRQIRPTKRGGGDLGNNDAGMAADDTYITSTASLMGQGRGVGMSTGTGTTMDDNDSDDGSGDYDDDDDEDDDSQALGENVRNHDTEVVVDAFGETRQVRLSDTGITSTASLMVKGTGGKATTSTGTGTGTGTGTVMDDNDAHNGDYDEANACFEKDVWYHPSIGLIKTDNARECQNRCAALPNSKCQHFSFRKNSAVGKVKCWLHESDAEKETRKPSNRSFTSGPRECTGCPVDDCSNVKLSKTWCFEENTKYSPKMAGEDTTKTASASECQDRCAAALNPECTHFSFWRNSNANEGRCNIHGDGATKKDKAPDFIHFTAGPPFCATIPEPECTTIKDCKCNIGGRCYLGKCSCAVPGRPYTNPTGDPSIAPACWDCGGGHASWTSAPLNGTQLNTAIGGVAAELSEQWTADVALGMSDAWLRHGQEEHASVASFARFSLDLMRFAAPPNLIAAAHSAAADEVRHATSAFELAAQLRPGRVGADRASSVDVGPFPISSVDLSPSLSELAQRTLVEGCDGESAAVSRLRHALNLVAPKSPARAVLSELLADETRHAALAWATIRWAARKGAHFELPVSPLPASSSHAAPIAPEDIVQPIAVPLSVSWAGQLSPDMGSEIAALVHSAWVVPWNAAAIDGSEWPIVKLGLESPMGSAIETAAAGVRSWLLDFHEPSAVV